MSYESVTDSESVGEGEEQGVEQGAEHSIMSHRTKAPIPEQTSISRKVDINNYVKHKFGAHLMLCVCPSRQGHFSRLEENQSQLREDDC